MKKELIPAGGYIRMSTDEQKESPARQRSELEALAAREGCQIVEWYEDHGMTGTESAKRTDYQRLLGDVKKKRIKAVLTYEQSRLSRETFFAAAKQWEVFHDAGAHVITSTGGKLDFNNPASLMMAVFGQHNAHDESRRTGMRSASGRRQKLQRGERPSGGSPFGYDRECIDESGRVVKRVGHRERFQKARNWKSRLVVSDDVEAVEAVRWIFQAAIAGQTVAGIARTLRDRGIASQRGGQFTRSVVAKMLRNPVYKGVLRAGHCRRTAKFATVTDRVVMLDGKIPPIVDTHTWQRAQDALRNSGKLKPKRPGKYLLSGLLMCKKCNARMRGNENSIGRRYFCCCDKVNEKFHLYTSADPLEKMVLEIVYDIVLKPNAEAARLGLVDDRSAETTPLEEALEAVRQRLKGAGEMLALAGSETNFRRLESQIEVWEREENDLGAKLDRMRERMDIRSAAGASIDQVREALPEVLNEDRVQVGAVLRQIVQSVSLSESEVGTAKQGYRLTTGELKLMPEIWTGPALRFFVPTAGSSWLRYVVHLLGGPLTIKQLAREMGAEEGAVGNHVQRLCDAELAVRTGGTIALSDSAIKLCESHRKGNLAPLWLRHLHVTQQREKPR